MKNQLNEYKKSLPSLHSFRVSVGMAYNIKADAVLIAFDDCYPQF